MGPVWPGSTSGPSATCPASHGSTLAAGIPPAPAAQPGSESQQYHGNRPGLTPAVTGGGKVGQVGGLIVGFLRNHLTGHRPCDALRQFVAVLGNNARRER